MRRGCRVEPVAAQQLHDVLGTTPLRGRRGHRVGAVARERLGHLPSRRGDGAGGNPAGDHRATRRPQHACELRSGRIGRGEHHTEDREHEVERSVLARKVRGVGGDPLDVHGGVARPLCGGCEHRGLGIGADHPRAAVRREQGGVPRAAGHVQHVGSRQGRGDLDDVRGGRLERARERCVVALGPIDSHGAEGTRVALYSSHGAGAPTGGDGEASPARCLAQVGVLRLARAGRRPGAHGALRAGHRRRSRVRRMRGHPVRHQRALPPHRLALHLRAPLDAPARPLGDLPADRGLLHARSRCWRWTAPWPT